MGGLALLRFGAVLPALALSFFSCKLRAKDDAAPASSAPVVAVRAPPKECEADKDCAPDNCCYAREATSCMPLARASCGTSTIQCEPYAGPRYACACVAGKCAGNLDVSTAPPPDAGPPSWTSGALSPGAVLDVIIGRGADVRACHAQAKKAYGAVVVSWNVLASGAVERSALASTTVGGPLSTCLVKKVGTWRFPKAKGPTQVTYEFRFGR